ncbi:uracil-DNA glycosylase [Deinococcus sp. QL22]|uniref:uracil-DNA glycosylase n=1 Tax=Deinococcus sp. QL22 TaxID=2939437 RepID=UPI0020171F42|nr:uracil-DNA glycosylase [Deinococcus sp. QL22]UQN05781.1 uracil-DNA glycosylase [Deinococcus sp. QL22]
MTAPHPFSPDPASATLALADAAALQALELRAKGCTACKLRPGCTQVVVADGNPQARLVIIGEGPGGDEDRLGRPFVGRAGQLMDKILAAVNLTRADTYITNIVKCRPPGNRAPEPDETQICTELWLEPQLALLRPQIILSLGNTPTQYLLGTRQGITRIRGSWHPFRRDTWTHDALLMPMFHPAYLLRNESRAAGGPKSLTWRDIREVAAVLRGEKEPEGLVKPEPADMVGQPGLF